MISKKIFYKSTGFDNEDYIFLDYDEDSGEFSIRKGYSYKDSDSLSWSEDETVYDVESFIDEFPEYEGKINKKINKIENEYCE